MKILLPVHHFPPRYSAGAELYTFRLGRWLQSKGHTVEVVCIESVNWKGVDRLSAQRDSYEGLAVWRLDVQVSPENWWPRNYDNPQLGAWFTEYIARERPDLAHFQAGYQIGAAPLRAAAAAGLPSVLTLHDYWFLCPRITLLRGDGTLCAEIPADPTDCAWCMRREGRGARLADQLSGGLAGKLIPLMLPPAERGRFAERRARLLPALALPDAVVAPSHFLASMFAPYVPAERMHVLRYGLDTGRLQRTAPKTDDGALRLGYIGQIAAHKGVHVLVEAMRLLPAEGRPVSLSIHGDEKQHVGYGEQLRRLIGSDPRIRLAGRFENSRLNEVLAQCDAMVTPSVWYENSPLAIMEAHAAGRPVITSALGGMAELVRHEVDGLHFHPGDAADLARQIQRLRSEPGLLARLRAGISPAATIDDEMTTLQAIYSMVIEQHSTPVGQASGAHL
jgi:glycosyltransferase involved in cell wall biosynthesis